MTKQLPGKITISESIYDCIEDNHMAIYDSDILNRINPRNNTLSVGYEKKSGIILKKKHSRKYCNGTRYIIEYITIHLIQANRLNNQSEKPILFQGFKW